MMRQKKSISGEKVRSLIMNMGSSRRKHHVGSWMHGCRAQKRGLGGVINFVMYATRVNDIAWYEENEEERV